MLSPPRLRRTRVRRAKRDFGRQKLREVGDVNMNVYADAIRACSAIPKEEEEERGETSERGVERLGVQGSGETAAAEPGRAVVQTGDGTDGRGSSSALRRALGLFDEVQYMMIRQAGPTPQTFSFFSSNMI